MAFLKNKAFLMAVRTGMALTAMLFFYSMWEGTG